MNEFELLRRLAQRHGVELAYRDYAGELVEARPESLVAVLRALGAPVQRSSDAADALRELEARNTDHVLDEVHVAWDGGAHIALARRRLGVSARLGWQLELEDGRTLEGSWEIDREAADRRAGPDRARVELALPELPFGRHRLDVEGSGESWVVSAPRLAFPALPGERAGGWGLFLPLHALRSSRSHGIGNLTDLARLMGWTASLGGEWVGVLPLLSVFLDQPCDPSPYTPVSRLFWNELFLDVERVAAGLSAGAAAAPAPPADGPAGRAEPPGLVDYREQMRRKRSALARLAEAALGAPGPAAQALEEYVRARPRLRDYARFRAVTERRRQPWREWPAQERRGDLSAAGSDPAAERYHRFVQWQLELQFAALRRESPGAGLYLDLPLGVHPDGYDAWREQHLFADGVSTGAPPDDFFQGGQDWGFAPPRPAALRGDGYRYPAECLRHHCRQAGLLRIDHVMGLHRQYWIPRGADARDGVYVRFPHQELYAVLCLESWRNRCGIVGEDLGTVPEDVRPAMCEHGLAGMYVLQFSIDPAQDIPLRPVGREQVASFGTHDTATWAGFLDGRDLSERLRIGGCTAEWARGELRRRESQRRALVSYFSRLGWLAPGHAEDPRALGRVALRWLADSRAPLVLVNLEDLWLETEAQNLPGSVNERPNWRRRAQLTLEQFTTRGEIERCLSELDARRTTARQADDRGS